MACSSNTRKLQFPGNNLSSSGRMAGQLLLRASRLSLASTRQCPAKQQGCTFLSRTWWGTCRSTRTSGWGGAWQACDGALIFRTKVSTSGRDVALESDENDRADEARMFAIAMAKVADDTKVEDLVVLHVAPLVSWTSYMVVCTVISKPQLLAVLARMERVAEEDWGRAKQNQPGSSPWEVLDFGDTIIHVFTPEQREYYDVESFYATAEEVALVLHADGAARTGGMVQPSRQAWRTTLHDTT